MDPKDIQLRNKQRERYQRGEDFQDEVRRSWRLLPKVWRMRITDGGGGTRPGDEIILTPDFNVLAEHKRVAGKSLPLSKIRPPQIVGLRDFDDIIERNLGLVFVSFHNPDKGLDECFAFRLVKALRYLEKHNEKTIRLEHLERGAIPAIRLPRIPGAAEPTYDFRGLLECYKSL
jgi:hypothetical protein